MSYVFVPGFTPLVEKFLELEMRDGNCELINDADNHAAFFILLSRFNIVIKVVQPNFE